MHGTLLNRPLGIAALLLGALAMVNSAAGQEDITRPARRLAPGVETHIPAKVEAEETSSIHNIVELTSIPDLPWTPNYTAPSRTLHAKADNARFTRRIWGLEFYFKPLRMIYVDIPQPSGRMQRKPVWYMVYRVKNTGEAYRPQIGDLGEYELTKDAAPVRFIPQFVLESLEFDKAYVDRIIPVALPQIQERESPPMRLRTSVEMAETEIPVSTEDEDRSVWGVTMWVDVDPRIDFFTVHVQGLTNAYKWVDPPGAYALGDPPATGRRFVRKTLQLNFWRPGDENEQREEEIRFGTPEGQHELYGVEEGVDYTWVYR
ncbi:MAG: hypothetical protein WDZ59_08920 [Pirellulales bacterium]